MKVNCIDLHNKNKNPNKIRSTKQFYKQYRKNISDNLILSLSRSHREGKDDTDPSIRDRQQKDVYHLSHYYTRLIIIK